MRPFSNVGSLDAEASGFRFIGSGVGVEQRDSLCRGIAFAIVLVLSCLLVVYAPLISGGAGWAAAGAGPGTARAVPRPTKAAGPIKPSAWLQR